MRALASLLLTVTLCPGWSAESPPSAHALRLLRPAEYLGMCDASAAVVVATNLFIVASDEDNVLRVYRSDQPGPPVQSFDFNAFLAVTGKSPEADLEGAARIGPRAFWIGSHGRNKKGKERTNRHRLFATDIRLIGGEVSLTPVGHPCRTLLADMLADPALARFNLAGASQLEPKEAGALNIEGLAATPEGQLLIGFRNPVPGGRALIIPLRNPNEILEGEHARFGAAIQLDLGGRGIRDLAWVDGSYLIISGPWHGGADFQLYRWRAQEPPEALGISGLNAYHPEALVIYPDRGAHEFQVLSDDGTRLIDGVPGKELTDPSRQRFRSFWLSDQP